MPELPRIVLLSEFEHADVEPLRTSSAVAELLIPTFGQADREMSLVVTLDVDDRLIAVDTVAIGDIRETFTPIAEVLRTVMLRRADHFYIAHNHTAGDATPSREDCQAAIRVLAAADTAELQLADALVFSRHDQWVSIREFLGGQGRDIDMEAERYDDRRIAELTSQIGIQFD